MRLRRKEGGGYRLASSMRLFILSNLLLLGLWSAGECSHTILAAASHVQVITSKEHAHDMGEITLAPMARELPKKYLLDFNLEDYDEMEAPPGLPEATHGPVVFFRRRRRGKLSPPGLH